MRTEYKRDVNHNYLLLYGDTEVDTSAYQVRMLVGNGIPSLLKCRLQGIDGNTLFSYEITSKQSVQILFEEKKYGLKELKMIFGGFIRAIEEMGEYLLNPGNLLIDPEYMYVDLEKEELYFCYLPGFDKEVRDQFRNLTEYLLPKLDHTDEKAVILGYGVYRRALEDHFHLEHIKEELYGIHPAQGTEIKEKLKEEETKYIQKPENKEIQEEEQSFNWKNEECFQIQEKEVEEKEGETEGKKKKWKNLFFGYVSGVAVLLMVFAANILGYLPWLRTEWLIGGILAVSGAGMLGYGILKKSKKRTSPEKKRDDRPEVFASPKAFFQETQNQVCQCEERKEESPSLDFGETMVLSEIKERGPASLVSREPGELATIYLKEEITVVGKLETASDAVIPLPTVSRIHARIRKRDEAYFLTDLNSRNGTSVNGKMLKEGEEYMLQNEDEVDFAQARYVFLE